MTTAITTDTGLLSTYVIAEAKLPDDLTLSEYEEVVHALRVLSEDARRRGLQRVHVRDLTPKGQPGTFRRVVPPEPEVLRAQYGSDFLLILGVVAGSGPAIGGAFLAIAKGIKIIQEARKTNEERLGLREDRLVKKSKRLERNAERKKAAATYKASRAERPKELIESDIRAREKVERQAINAVMPPSEREAFDAEVGDRLYESDAVDVYAAADTLAEYNVGMRVEQG